MPPRISVIVRTKNDAPHVQRALGSVTKQTLARAIEVHVGLDAASSDGTAAKVEELVDAQRGAVAAWKLIPHPALTPFRALEHLLRLSSEADTTFVLDADNVFAPNRVVRQLSFGCGKGVCTTGLRIVDERAMVPKTSIRPWFPQPIGGNSILRQFLGHLSDMNTMMISQRYLPRLLSAFGSLDQEFDWINEDYLISMLATLDGDIDYHHEILTEYHLTGRNLTSGAHTRARRELQAKRMTATRRALLRCAGSDLERGQRRLLEVVDAIRTHFAPSLPLLP